MADIDHSRARLIEDVGGFPSEELDKLIEGRYNKLSLNDDAREWFEKTATLFDSRLRDEPRYKQYSNEIETSAMMIMHSGPTYLQGASDVHNAAIEDVNTRWSFSSLTGTRRLIRYAPTLDSLPFGGRYADRFIRAALIDTLSDYTGSGVVTDRHRELINDIVSDEAVRQRHGVPLHLLHSKTLSSDELNMTLAEAMSGGMKDQLTFTGSHETLFIEYNGTREDPAAAYERILAKGMSKEDEGRFQRFYASQHSDAGEVDIDTTPSEAAASLTLSPVRSGEFGDAAQPLTVLSDQTSELDQMHENVMIDRVRGRWWETEARVKAQSTVGNPEYNIWLDGKIIIHDWQPPLRNPVAPYTTTTPARALVAVRSGIEQASTFFRSVFNDQNFDSNFPAREMTDLPFQQMWQETQLPVKEPPVEEMNQ
jgi:hypothetical protein